MNTALQIMPEHCVKCISGWHIWVRITKEERHIWGALDRERWKNV